MTGHSTDGSAAIARASLSRDPSVAERKSYVIAGRSLTSKCSSPSRTCSMVRVRTGAYLSLMSLVTILSSHPLAVGVPIPEILNRVVVY